MKKIIKLIALMLAMLLSFSVFACKGNPPPFIDREKEELFSALKQAYQTYKGYTGGVTITETRQSSWEYISDGGLEDSAEYLYNVKSTVNPSTNEYAFQTKNADGEMLSTSKIFKVEDQYYYFYKDYEYDEIYYSFYSDLQAENSIESIVKDVCPFTVTGNMFTANSFSQLKNAFATYVPVLIENQKVQSGTNNYSESDQTHDVTGGYELDVKKEQDDAITLTVRIWQNKNSVSPTDSSIDNASYTRSITAKNGKIVAYEKSSQIETEEKDNSTGTVSYGYKDYSVDSVTIFYEYDQEFYNSVLAPDYQTAENNQSLPKQLNFNFGGASYDVSCWYKTQTATELYNETLERFESLQPNLYQMLGTTWYTDKEMTQVFDPSQLTVREFFAITDLYGTISVPEGKAILKTTTYIENDFADEFELILFKEVQSLGYITSTLQIYDIAEYPTYTIEYESTYADGTNISKAFVNGESKADGSIITLESQKIYNIEEYKVVSLSDFTIFDIGLRNEYL